MPRKCSVAGCKSNYDNEEEYFTVFSLPKIESLRSQWLQSIPTDFTGLKNPLVCIKHFQKEDIIFEDEVLVKGELQKFPRKVPKYKEASVPTIFPDLPKYLSKDTKTTKRLIDVEEDNKGELKKFRRKVPKYKEGSISTISPDLHKCLSKDTKRTKCLIDVEGGNKGEFKKFCPKVPKYKKGSIPTIFPKDLSKDTKTTRRLINVEEDNFNRAVRESIDEFNNHKKLNTISNFDDIINYMKNRGNVSKTWVVLKKQSALSLCFMNTDLECPAVSGCINIAENLEFTLHIDNIKIGMNQLPIKGNRLTSLDILEDILLFIETKKSVPKESMMDAAIRILKLLPNYDESKCLPFLVEQLVLSGQQRNSRIYSYETIIFASCLYTQSSSIYNTLHQSQVLCLPHPKHLQKLISKFSVNTALLEIMKKKKVEK